MGNQWFVVTGGLIAGLLAWLVDRHRRAYTDLATTPAAAVFAGRNEVKGRAWTATPLLSYRTQTPCVWWSYLLEEERRHTRIVTSTDSQGRTTTRTETYNQWHEIDRRDDRLAGFEVVDDTGSVPVALHEAKVVPARILHERFRHGDSPGFFESLFAPSSGATGWYRETEHVLALGDDLFVAGEAYLDEVSCVPVLRGRLLVSVRSEESHRQGLGAGVALLLVLAMGMLTFGLAMAVTPDEPGQPRSIAVGVIVSLTLLAIAWVVTLFNRLQLLIESVSRAWTLIDVQLQRRHDLIPPLARVVAAHAAHEQRVLTQVAAARGWQAGQASQPAQLAGEAASQTAALNQIVAVAEAHPELGADASFVELQHALADAEARIAASRTFFNDTVLLLHDRSRTFPGVLFAHWLQLPYHETISAQGFERTVPAVEHTFA
jgi:hypothetical protein